MEGQVTEENIPRAEIPKKPSSTLMTALLVIMVLLALSFFFFSLLLPGNDAPFYHAILILVIQNALWILVMVLICLNPGALKKHYRAGIFIGVIIFFISLPQTIASICCLDMNGLLKSFRLPPLPQAHMVMFISLALATMLVVQFLSIAWYTVLYAVAAGEWEHYRPKPFPLLMRQGPPPWAALAWASLFGIATAAVSGIVFKALRIDSGETIKQLIKMYPKFFSLPPVVMVIIILSMLITAAILEELMFRGALQGFLLRLSGNDRTAVILSVVLVSVLWALLHIENSNMPAVKCAQIFLIGLVLSEFARRRGIETAMAGHIALNVATLVISLALGM
jgi:membrane protease YdiL (CAAX protease family)